jgi:hypothetical protein
MGLVWYKSTMMKSIIQSNTVSESAKSWESYKQWVTVTNNHLFKETKKPVKKSNLSHSVEHID